MDNTISNQNPKSEKIYMTIGIIGLLLIIGIIFFIYTKNQYRKVDDIVQPVAATKINYFENLHLTAKAAVVWNVKDKTFVYKKNELSVLPLASLTKLMTGLVATEILPEHSTVKISGRYFENGYDPVLYQDENWNVEKLISLTLMTSSNSGARVLGAAAGSYLPKNFWNSNLTNTEDIFIDYLNKRARELGLKSTNFYNDSGLDVNEEKSGAYGNARDVALLMGYILENHADILNATKYSNVTMVSSDNFIHELKNTNVVVDSIPGILGSKTGFTDLAQGNLAVAFAPGLEGPYIAIVLGSTFDGRFTDTQQLIDATVNTISQ